MLPVARSLDLIRPPAKALFYQIADFNPKRPYGRPWWGMVRGIGRPVHIDSPHRVRYLDADRRCLWGFVVVDPEHEGSEPVMVPNKREQRRALQRGYERKSSAKRPRSERQRVLQMLARAQARVAVLEERLKTMDNAKESP